MPYSMINGVMTETPIGWNPAPQNPYQTQANVPAVGPGAQPGMNPWQSRNLPGIGGQGIDPRFQSNTSYGQNTSYDDMVRAATGQQAAYRGPANFGMAGQQYASGTGPFAAPTNLTNQNRALTADGGIPAPPMTSGASTQTPQATGTTRQTPGATYQPPAAVPPPQTRQTPGAQWSPTGPYTTNYAQGGGQAPWWAMAAPPYNPFQGFGGGQFGGGIGNTMNTMGNQPGYGEFNTMGGGGVQLGPPPGGFGGLGGMAFNPQTGRAEAVGQQGGTQSMPYQPPPIHPVVAASQVPQTHPLVAASQQQYGQYGMQAPPQSMPWQPPPDWGLQAGGSGMQMMPGPQAQMGGFPSNYGRGGGGMAQAGGPQMQMPNLNNLLQQFQRPAMGQSQMAPQGMGGMGGGQQQLMQQLARLFGMM